VKFKIRFNRSRGQPGRGTPEHVWRVFAGNKEYLAKHVILIVPSRSEKEERSDDWNMVCEGEMVIDRETATIKILP
jgi:hypothetical protein